MGRNAGQFDQRVTNTWVTASRAAAAAASGAASASGAAGWIRELSRRTGLATRLGAEFFDEGVVTHNNRRADGSEQMPETGRAIPTYACAMGEVLLAYNPNVATELPSRPLRNPTDTTITGPAKLMLQFAKIAARGIATEEDEAGLDESSITAPVADRIGTVIAAVAVVLPSSE